ncbi:MAG TPA: putative LPS assembly protein LptD, partial [Longimicrobiales bacterium]|nr:putative LPS assembly protein LptD [Longimicrobiales bacterium]
AFVPLAAQQDTVPPDSLARDSVLTPEQRIMERLRGLPPAVGGVSLPGDTLPIDTLGDTAAGRRRAAPRSSITPDSVMRELLALRGYQALAYTADSAVHYAADSARVRLLGRSELERAGQGMRADSLLVYDLDVERVCGYGQPIFTGREIQPVVSQQVCYDVRRQMGVALGAETTFTQGAEWRLWGEEIYQQGDSRTYVHDARFTSCDRTDPHYHFAAREVKMVRDSVMVARDITLNFGDVPVFWMPFMVQSMKRGRRSGLLTPAFSINQVVRTSDRLNRRIDNLGAYWAINEHMGAQLAYGWFANNYSSVHGMFEYRFLRRFLEGSVEARQFWRTTGGTELTLASRNSWAPDERTRVQLTAQYASSSQFVARNTFDPRELSREMQSNASVSRRLDWGSLDISAVRRQNISDNQVNLTLPKVGLNVSPVTLFRTPASQAAWYNNATWNGSLGFQETQRDVDDLLPGSEADLEGRQANLTSTFRMGDLSWRQNFRLEREERLERLLVGEEGEPLDSIRPGNLAQTVAWDMGVDYQVRLIGTSTFTPGLKLVGGSVRNDSLAAVRPELVPGGSVTAPVRMSFDARLRTDLFGFFPGVGPLSRIRHRVSPSISYAYSPAPTVDTIQRLAFGNRLDNIREQNRISIGLNQTIEAKYDEEVPPDTAEVEEGDGPRRLPQARKLSLLSLQTDAIAYDFVRASEEGHGITNEELRNSISSDLLRGFRFSIAHDLFEEGERPEEGGARPRSFSPHLQKVNASFSFNSDSWLFRLLRLGPARGGDGDADAEAEAERMRREGEPAGELGSDDEPITERQLVREGGSLGMTGGRPADIGPARGGGRVGTWDASVDYSWNRPRDAQPTVLARNEQAQLLRGTVGFQPTELWSANWRTEYSITDGEFLSQMLTLSRDLHRWQANFDFVRAQNGNFTFQFRVSLRDNPDLKLDYEQRSDPGATDRFQRF